MENGARQRLNPILPLQIKLYSLNKCDYIYHAIDWKKKQKDSRSKPTQAGDDPFFVLRL
jgi:hypothetical protein